MAVSISDEDFQRLQNSLIDLKNENYNLQEKNRKQAKGAFIISIFLFSRHHIFYPVRSIFSSCWWVDFKKQLFGARARTSQQNYPEV